ncbi:hypothetical protein FDECE_16014 [Fusarium decemcellulare]|nr:hypothetical protein FDECE_16014 [Fusarium decemcellulare]
MPSWGGSEDGTLEEAPSVDEARPPLKFRHPIPQAESDVLPDVLTDVIMWYEERLATINYGQKAALLADIGDSKIKALTTVPAGQKEILRNARGVEIRDLESASKIICSSERRTSERWGHVLAAIEKRAPRRVARMVDSQSRAPEAQEGAYHEIEAFATGLMGELEDLALLPKGEERWGGEVFVLEYRLDA